MVGCIFIFTHITDFPWAEEVELTTYRLVAAGLPTWYYRMTEFTVKITTNNRPEVVSEYQSLNLFVMAGPFYVFAVGVLLSLIIFLAEISYSYFGNRKPRKQNNIRN